MKTILILMSLILQSCSPGGGESLQEWGSAFRINFPDNEFTRADHCLEVIGSSVFIWGGTGFNKAMSSIESFNSGVTYSLQNKSYKDTPTDDQAPLARNQHQCVTMDDVLFVWGGRTQTGGSLRTGSFFDPTVGNWTKMPETNAPSQSYNNSFVSVDRSIISWGGGSVGVDTGAVYDFESNLWNTMPDTNSPPARTRHSTVKIDHGIIVWGGVKGSVYYRDGYIYDLDSNSWTEISSADAPVAREGHSAVWTGEKMIVWGGLNADGFTNSGGIYDLASDSWESLPLSPLIPRVEHVALWTGDYMFIWGGQSLDAVMNNGAAFSLESNSWSTIGDYGLTPRIGHKAIMVEDSIFMFGGWDGPYAKFGPTDNKYRNNGVIISF